MNPRLLVTFISALFMLNFSADAFICQRKTTLFSRNCGPSLSSSVQTRVVATGGDFLPVIPSFQTVLLASGDLSTPEVAGYFVFLSALIAVPFVGGTLDGFRIAEVFCGTLTSNKILGP